jgi:hypothetical protein
VIDVGGEWLVVTAATALRQEKIAGPGSAFTWYGDRTHNGMPER